MVQCQNCKQRYVYSDEGWKELKLSKEVAKVIKRTYQEAVKKIELLLETTGQIRKRLGVKKEKKRKIGSKPKFIADLKKQNFDFTVNKIKAKWRPIIAQLTATGSFTVSGDTHYGSLRGRDILKHAKRDLKKIGINTKIIFDDNYGGTLEVVK